jgi:hypothetical protein
MAGALLDPLDLWYNLRVRCYPRASSDRAPSGSRVGCTICSPQGQEPHVPYRQAYEAQPESQITWRFRIRPRSESADVVLVPAIACRFSGVQMKRCLDYGYRIPVTGHKIPDAGYNVPDTGDWRQIHRCQDTAYWISDTGHRKPNT